MQVVIMSLIFESDMTAIIKMSVDNLEQHYSCCGSIICSAFDSGHYVFTFSVQKLLLSIELCLCAALPMICVCNFIFYNEHGVLVEVLPLILKMFAC